MANTNLLARREARFGRLLIAPALVVILGLILYPIIYNIYLSFFNVSLAGRNVFLGLSNYLDVLTDSEFWSSVLTTMLYVVLSTFGTTILGLIVAMVMNRAFPLRWLARSLILLPYVAPVISVVFAWQFFFDPVNGIFMHVMVEKLGWINQRVNLISEPGNALWVAILFNMWRNFPFSYLMILSRLQGIDENLYEAAEIDGASAWQKFRFITLAEIYFVVGALILLRFIWNFNKFEEVYLLTGINVKTMPIYIYLKAFIGTMELGTASALAVVQFLILVGIILVYVKRVLKW
ncbi:MAG: sugar ABC transporter permease [Spirochaetaceae bacterium]|nr:sugar ABC transporter permease [Spirochaetaceae bacterium]MDT8297513.1 sugar ABC transporter permease [Spirochaetaceae bacterium]